MSKKYILLIALTLHGFSVIAQIITTIAGGGIGGGIDGLGDGLTADNAKFGNFCGIAFDSHNNLFIADKDNNIVRKIDAISNVITVYAGTGVAGFNGDSSLATLAQLNDPGWLVFDTNDNLYISDRGNNRIRTVDATGIMSTFAGNGIPTFSGDSGQAINASLNGPEGICMDSFGNLYIVDGANPRIRKVDNNGIISTIAGNGTSGYSGDGGVATDAEMSGIYGICNDNYQNIYIADFTDNRIRKVNIGTGIISTVAGNGNPGFFGDSLNANISELHSPFSVTSDFIGNIFIADYSNNRVREIFKTNNNIYSIAGVGLAGFSGDGGLADTAKLNRPAGVVFDHCGNLYIADNQNKRVRKVSFNPECWPEAVPTTNSPTAISIYPNPASTTLTITGIISQVQIINMLGQAVYSHQYSSNTTKTTIDIAALPTGVYFVKVNEGYVQKVVKE